MKVVGHGPWMNATGHCLLLPAYILDPTRQLLIYQCHYRRRWHLILRLLQVQPALEIGIACVVDDDTPLKRTPFSKEKTTALTMSSYAIVLIHR